MGEVRAHKLRRKKEQSCEQHRRKDAHGGQRIAQQRFAGAMLPLAVMIADERLRALRHADHEIDDDGGDVGDDRVGDNAVCADAGVNAGETNAPSTNAAAIKFPFFMFMSMINSQCIKYTIFPRSFVFKYVA